MAAFKVAICDLEAGGGGMRSQSVTASEKRNVRYQPYES